MLNLVRSLSTVGKNVGTRRKTTFHNRLPLYQGCCYRDFFVHAKKLIRPLIVSQNGQMWDSFFLMTGSIKIEARLI